jgi:hypothetical protein
VVILKLLIMKVLLLLMFAFSFANPSNSVTESLSPKTPICVWIADGTDGEFMWDEWNQCTYNIYNCCECPVISCTAGDCATARNCAFAACNVCCFI